MREVDDSKAGFVRSRADFRPAYLDIWDSGELEQRVARGLQLMTPCRACPRVCGVDRLQDEIGACRAGRLAPVSSAFPHHGEENCLRGWKGSGTIFFSGCNLRCVFCQNSDISWGGQGQPLTATQIALLMLELQDRGCHNINFVTPEHVVPQLLEAVLEAVEQGLRLPLVYNTSGYDCAESLALLDGVIDIYMPDFKFWDAAVAKRLVMAEDYPERAREAIREMHRQVGDLVVDEDGVALRGLLIRHLVMPRGLAGTRQIMRYLAQEISRDTFVNLMAQYRPAALVLTRAGRYPEIDRAITVGEFVEAKQICFEEGIRRFSDP
ncbi:MAG: radical SAM protein [Acidobacteria bacterium]|nr:MAG: radical SAM protein [Acidobacteriota bacterium]